MKGKLKKSISLLCVGAMSLALFAGCGGGQQNQNQSQSGSGESSSGSSNTVTEELVLWMPPFGTEESLDKEVWENTLKPFEEENNVKVSLEIVPWANYEEKYLTGISSGQGPDVGYMYMEMVNDYIETEAITPFDDYLTQEDRDNFYYLDKGVINGKQYMLPIVVGSARVIFYNKAILEEAGVETVPSSWDEFKEACKKISGIGKTPFLQQWGDKSKGAMNAIFFPYLWQAGGDIFSEDGTKALFDSEAGIKAATFLADLRFKDNILPSEVTSMSEDQVFSEFKNGNVAFVAGPTNSGAAFSEAGIDWDYITSFKDAKMGTFAAADSLVLVSGSKNKELAAKLATYMLSGPSMTEFHKMAPFPPVGKDEAYNDDPVFKKVYEDDKDALTTLPAVKGSAGIYDNLYKNLQLMMLGELTPEEAINNSAEFANSSLATN